MKEKKVTPVDIHNDYLMVSLGIRPSVYAGRDDSVWTKTDKERELLSKYRKRKYKFMSSVSPTKSIPVKDKLIIYLKKNNVFSKTTYSIVCNQHDISSILGMYQDKKGNNLVSKYYFNGKTYSEKERPFWNL